MIDRDIIRKFIRGKASKEEVKLVMEWIYSDDIENELSEIYNKSLSDTSKDLEWDEFHQLEKIREKLKAQDVNTEANQILQADRRKPIKSRTFLKIAASLAIFISAALAVWKLGVEKSEAPLVSVEAKVEKSTSLGQKSTLFLEDGTRVVLNSGSRILFLEKFTGQQRVVELRGEAYFDVKSDSLKPFIVNTENLTTKAIGTSFNVSTDKEGAEEVSLVSGKIVVAEHSGKMTYLEPGEQLVYKDHKSEKSTFDVFQTTAWKDGILYFNNSPFPEIIERLERWYGVDISVANDPNETKHYTGRFNNESLENVLEGIGFINDFNFEIEGQQVMITFRKKL